MKKIKLKGGAIVYIEKFHRTPQDYYNIYDSNGKFFTTIEDNGRTKKSYKEFIKYCKKLSILDFINFMLYADYDFDINARMLLWAQGIAKAKNGTGYDVDILLDLCYDLAFLTDYCICQNYNFNQIGDVYVYKR